VRRLIRRLVNGVRWYAVTYSRIGARRFHVGVAFLGLLGLALVEGVRTRWRRARGKKPRLIWGPTAILNIKYDAAALRERGYESRTYVDAPQTISRHEDFDIYRNEFPLPRWIAERSRDYYIFASLLRQTDVFLFAFDMGVLRATPLQWLEYPLLRLASKKLIVTPFGGDAAVIGELGGVERELVADYPQLPGMADMLRRRILHTLRWCSVSVRTHGIGFQPSYDAIVVTRLVIDLDAWRSEAASSDADGRNGAVSVVHAPNHRHIKGTAALEGAVAALREEGLAVDLVILEGRPNEEVKKAVRTCDIVADQFVLGYGFFAVEGMAAGKPVMSCLDEIFEEVRDTEQLRSCPIVDTDRKSLTGNLRALVEDPARRRQLGEAGRQFATRYHSYGVIADAWEAIIDHAWRKTPLPPQMLPAEKRPRPE